MFDFTMNIVTIFFFGGGGFGNCKQFFNLTESFAMFTVQNKINRTLFVLSVLSLCMSFFWKESEIKYRRKNKSVFHPR